MIWVPPGRECEEYRSLECDALQFGRDLPLLRGSPLSASSEPLEFCYEIEAELRVVSEEGGNTLLRSSGQGGVSQKTVRYCSGEGA